MQINFTLIGQLITFAVLVIFTMKYVWPPIIKAIEEREKKIAQGLAAGEKGEKDLQAAREKSVVIIQEAKEEAARIVDAASKRATKLMEETKETARQEGATIIKNAKDEIERMLNDAKRDLQNQVSNLAISMAEKIVQRDIDATTHQELIKQFVEEI